MSDSNTAQQPYNLASNAEIDRMPSRTKDSYSPDEIAEVLGVTLNAAYETGMEIVTIDDLTIAGSNTDRNGNYRCRTKTSWPLLRRAQVTITRYPMYPLGGGIIETDLDEGESETLSLGEWQEFKQETNRRKLHRHDKHNNVFEIYH